MDFTTLRSAVKDGLKSVASMRNPNKNEDVNSYNKLQPSDFKGLIEKFGVENVMKYIAEMENKPKVGE